MIRSHTSAVTTRTRRSARLVVSIGAAVAGLVLAGTTAAASAPPSPPPDTAMTAGAGPSDCSDVADTTSMSTEAMGTTPMATEATTDMMTTEPMTGSEPMAAAPFVQVMETAEYGEVLVDAECWALYMFVPDSEGESTCTEGCAAAWPPLLVPEGAVPPLADELDPSLFSVVEHPEQGPMLKVGDWPLYYFASDTGPGVFNGQGANDVWWVVAPDGTPIESMTPTTTGA